MRRPKVGLVLASSIIVLAATKIASAADMDPTPERLYLEPPNLPANAPGCQQIAANPQLALQPPFRSGATPNQYPCLPNNVAWANLMNELGMAIAPSALHPARTTGFGGFALSLEATFTHINANATAGGVQYWHAGTRGAVDPNTNQFSVQNTAPDSILQVYSLKARKGLPYGFEITGVLGWMANTSLWVGGADVRWALLEGFRTGLLGYIPDIAIGSGVRTLAGSSTFFLTTVGIDAQISKPFVLGDSAVLTPYLGGQRVIIFADSAAVDLTPNVDAYSQCGYQGNNVPGNPQAKGPSYDGTPLCSKQVPGSTIPNNGDFNNTTTFQRSRMHRWRALGGVTYKYELLYLAGHFAMDATNPSAENANLGVTGARQWTLSLEAGVSF